MRSNGPNMTLFDIPSFASEKIEQHCFVKVTKSATTTPPCSFEQANG